MRYFVIIGLFGLLSAGCKKTVSEQNKLEQASWLIGSWVHADKDGKLKEKWRADNDSLYRGWAYFIKGSDTLHREQVRLFLEKSRLCYEATVKGQNNNLPIRFYEETAHHNALVFSNPQHDYPQKISYKKITADSLIITLTGKQQGKASTETYAMKRLDK